MLGTLANTIFNGLLMGTSGYAMYTIDAAEHPFAFTACAVGFCHGCAGIYTRLFDNSCSEDGPCMNRAKKLTTSCMEIISVPMINIDLYSHSQQSSALALGHGLFIIPLAFDITFNFFGSEGDEGESTSLLKDLTALGNIVSLLFFAVNESNLHAGIMTFAAFFAYSGSMVMEYLFSGTEENSTLAGYSLFFGVLPLAISSGGAS